MADSQDPLDQFNPLYQPKIVTGTAGNDQLYGGKGADSVDGGDGEDTYFVGASYADALIARVGDATVVSTGKYADTLINVEYLQFSDVRVRLDDPVLKQAVQHAWGNGADTLIGNDLGYVLNGGDGDDVFTGNGGDDTLYGGKGNDTAVYRGNRADYVVEYGPSGQVFVRDLVSGRDGSDWLGSIEVLRFADMTLSVAPATPAALPAVPVTPPPFTGAVLVPNSASNVVNGTSADDVLTGSSGDDSLYGGKGNDTAVYRGNREDYFIEYDAAHGQIVVHDKVAGRDGHDRIVDIETLRFADMQIAVEPLPMTTALAQAPWGGIGSVVGVADERFQVLDGVPPVFTMTTDLGTNAQPFTDIVLELLSSIDAVADEATQAGRDTLFGAGATHAVDVDLIGLPEPWVARDWYAHVTHCQY